ERGRRSHIGDGCAVADPRAQRRQPACVRVAPRRPLPRVHGGRLGEGRRRAGRRIVPSARRSCGRARRVRVRAEWESGRGRPPSEAKGMAMRILEGRVCAVLALVLAACAINVAPSAAEELPTEPKCEFIASPGSTECMLPFPDDYYTKADATSPTGRRIDFRELAMPRNASGAPIEAAPYNSGDGFSPGSAITLKIPGIETAA